MPIQGVSVSGKGLSVSVNREYLANALEFDLTEIHLWPVTSESLPCIVCQNKGKRMVIALLGGDNKNPMPPIPKTSEPLPQSISEPPAAIEPPINPQPKTEMTKTTTTAENPAPESTVKAVIEQIEQIKETLKGVITEFSDVLTTLKQAEKEKKATEKEIESIRATLRTIQNVKI